ncbi:Gfo/Idh/MocA family oxidoreductase [Tannockella kyphosi]|uniref:Gfo/Idh/MocA family oxidoreductase n=1 Tax=Tannockella kyphosi TaxID=2899121 RepID=UPI0020116580|nr:Gfo/Idh/MocA family oxidoreductase [Tannockella kyphosi]
MEKIKIGIIGNGWRTMNYVQIIEHLNEVFEIKGMLLRNDKKAKDLSNRFPTFTNKEAFFQLDVDFIFCLLPKGIMVEWCQEIFERNIPVLIETSPGKTMEDLHAMWELKEKYNARIQVAEQYFLQPYHSTLISVANSGLLGDITDCTIGAMHGYHGTSVMRKLLGIGYENFKVSGKEFHFPVTYTHGRAGASQDGDIVQDCTKKAVFEFENGKVGFFDFGSEKYFNRIRDLQMSLRGVRGEVFNTTIHYLNEDNLPISQEMNRVDAGTFGNLEGYFHIGFTFQGNYVYKNPFEKYKARLSDDEIAMAGMLVGMAEYVKTGKEFYSLQEALQDTYLMLLMEESIEKGTVVQSTTMPWAK